ncbi:peptidoglycan-binding domain-containing protein [Chitinispirillales bacterium ANBcel5]|uniref:peptidoglycan-binding domain-containing protein n=1 Tax=Cellulosispirillum alkaliphilum TaxID=3039283 RepID=UPI002A4EAC07|nr:peptidoglycan-binding domain-containing protein [Chitinispirillales bacterium ANBcel5]
MNQIYKEKTKHRLWLEHDPSTQNQGRTNLCVLGNESRNTGGNIHIFDSETDFTDMEVFKKNFVKRVESGGRLKMRVNYSQPAYGKYDLRDGDSDTEKKWGGEIRDEQGAFVEELQKDLFTLGYWITEGKDVPAIGAPMIYSGVFDKGVYSGLKTFQFEHMAKYGLDANGIIDAKTADAIKECLADKDFERPGVPVDISTIAARAFCGSAINKPERPQRFYQLPPSKSHCYKRYGNVCDTSTGVLSDVYHNDIWGAKEHIDALIKLAEEWKSENDVIEIGNISLFTGGRMPPHSSHQDGYGVDIRSAKVGSMQRASVENRHYCKDSSVRFARKARELGFGRIMTQCPHVTVTCNEYSEYTPSLFVVQYEGHHHHFHFDFWESGARIREDQENLDLSYCSSCIKRDECNSQHKRPI